MLRNPKPALRLAIDTGGTFTDCVWVKKGSAQIVKVFSTPADPSRAIADAGRWVGTVRREVLDRMLIFGCRQLRSVLAEYADHDNGHRPHRALGQAPPLGARRTTCHPAGRKGCATGSARWADP